ncbi:uncharacterized protein EV422DRAFT_578010 [Fimicolochytrium jonesii]|uniref:uncharacterized protein n=1 Tax=Fimicolochytrium jonesii TaxID=1396493 RepID=UPI0022FEB6F5|nr:uncharacterized protein EV422DRAFT_578010 [Fimicolochytrium jonesii]KAI8821716.1 hypothetical protein EV422DRAFT_578010 [Fimicolochytrium jonesii]
MPLPYDILSGHPLPTCPYPSSSLPPPSSPGPKLHNPNVSLTFLIIGLTSVVFAGVVKGRYDGARVFNRRIGDASVRNGWWSAWFAVLGVSFLIDFVRYTLDLPHQRSTTPIIVEPIAGSKKEATVEPQIMDAWLLLSSAVLRSFATLLLTLALNYQLQHRSSFVMRGPVNNNTATDNPPPDPRSSSSSIPPRRPVSYPAYGSSTTPSSRAPSVSLLIPDPSTDDEHTPSPATLRATNIASAAAASRRTSAQTSPHRSRAHRSIDASEEQALLEGIPRDDDSVFGDDEDTRRGGSRCCTCSWWRCMWDGFWGRVFASWPFAGCVLWGLNLFGIWLATNPPTTTPFDSATLPPPLYLPNPTPAPPLLFYLSTTLSLLQHLPIPLLILLILSGTAPSPSPPPSRRTSSSTPTGRRRRHHPTWTTKLLLLTAGACYVPWMVEPGVLTRAIDAVVMHGPAGANYESRVCAVPPWWWLEADDSAAKWKRVADAEGRYDGARTERPDLHGWASWVDVGMWVGFVGECLFFAVVRREWRRNKEEWVWLTVSELQSIFDFRRY